MKSSIVSSLLSLGPLLVQAAVPPPGADGKYTLTAPGIEAKFIAYSAAITNLVVSDKNGIKRDIILGYDNASFYPVDPNHPDYGAVPGRYVNRIKDHTYVMDGTRYYTEANDGNGTLHSGLNGWSRRTWNVTEVTPTSITFSMHDEGNSELGMPGLVLANVTHSVSAGAWSTKLVASAPEHKTPLMLTTHPYWNLDAFANPATDLILNHTLSMPYSKRMIGINQDTQSTGALPAVAKGTINDFWSAPKQIGASDGDLAAWVGNCGTGNNCTGYNNQWVIDRDEMMSMPGMMMQKPVATLSSEWSGIKWDLHTDQGGIVIYSCHWMGGVNQIKASQGGPASNGFVKRSGCVAVEPQDWVDGINHPEWNRKQIYGPDTGPFTSSITYKFSTFGSTPPTGGYGSYGSYGSYESYKKS